MNEKSMIAVFDGIAKTAERAMQGNSTDYVDEDGLLVCGKCHTRKQTRISIFGQIRTPYCLCKCAAEKREAEKAAEEQRERMERIQRMRYSGFPDAEMRKWNFAVDDMANEKISTIARKYVEHFPELKRDGKGLLFYGTVGTGKTFYSACIVNALIDKGIPCLMTNFSRLVNTISGMFEGKQEYIDSLNNYALLVIDDLAAERDTEYMNEIVQTIVDSRYRAGLPTIITTNLSAEELKNPADIRKTRTYSRLLEMTLPIEVSGKDRRKAKLVQDYKDYKDMLGI